MNVRTVIYLDKELDARLRRVVPHRDLDRFIEDAVSEKLAMLEAQILDEMRSGYLEVQEDRRLLSQEWDLPWKEA